MGRRKPTVTEQVEHAQLCLRANERGAKEAELNTEPEPPEDLVAVGHACGWWPKGWLDETDQGDLLPSREDTLDRVVGALGMLVKLAYTHPGLSDAQRKFYRDSASDARRGYVEITRTYATLYVQQANAEYEARRGGGA